MRGDLSKWEFRPEDNFTGVLEQQGRVRLDQDGNARTLIDGYLRRILGADTIGEGVVAVPAAASNSFRVTEASTDGATVEITLEPGRAWVDGLVLHRPEDAPLPMIAEYLGPPLQSPQESAATIGPGIRDAVVLDVWEEELNAFQDPLNLLEPALGGVDTTQRIKLCYALRLYRLGPDEDCEDLELADDFDAKGRLTVTPEAGVLVAGDCPVQAGGGYTGFEHYLYRIEIAEPLAGAARFKWSRFGAGLVGRGTFDATGPNTGDVTVTGNDQSINHSGLTEFYLEALAEDSVGCWSVVFSADAGLVSDGQLSLTNVEGTWPAGPGVSAFFRLWDGIEPIATFVGAPATLQDGIQLELDAPLADNSNYRPGDYWTFPVRAAGVDFDPSVWPSNAPPQGIRHHRAPLAVLSWEAAVGTITAPDQIHDCRRVFQPLARLEDCCTYTVGAHGDFQTIQEAVDALPAAGGKICVLPGRYVENVTIDTRDDISIHGCGPRSHVESDNDGAVFRIANSRRISIDSLRVEAAADGPGILVEGDDPAPSAISLTNLIVSAGTRSAIEVYDEDLNNSTDLTIRDCRILMRNVPSPFPGILVTARDALLEHNRIQVELPDGPRFQTAAGVPVIGRGGLHIGGTSERIRVIDNLIESGLGNGITLGTVQEVDGPDEGILGTPPWIVNAFDECDPCADGDTRVPPPDPGGDDPEFESAGPLFEIRIERNRIQDMGLNGIGVVGFFDADASDEMISVFGLEILGNHIRRCLQRRIERIPDNMIDSMGYGGVALADVTDLTVRDNLIEDNGIDSLDPICGVFVLFGQSLEFSRNKIVDNGRTTSQQPDNPGRARGGIIVLFALAPPRSGDDFELLKAEPALRVHDNVVSAPLGRALSTTAIGPVSVADNYLASQGMILSFADPSFIATTVAILNLGNSFDSLALTTPRFAKDTASTVSVDLLTALAGSEGVLPLADRVDRNLIPDGNVLFNDNQVVSDMFDEAVALSVSSIFIASLDGISFADNQCQAQLLADIVLSQVILLSVALRATGNRLEEVPLRALFSAVTLGVLQNITANNECTHCLFIAGGTKIDKPNLELISELLDDFCGSRRADLAEQLGLDKKVKIPANNGAIAVPFDGN